MKKNAPLVLCILDGWGHREEAENNAIKLAETPFWDNLLLNSPYCFLETQGSHVGLPDKQAGSSEVGHMNIGAGRVIFQNLVRINDTIKREGFENNPKIKKIVSSLAKTKGKCHILGLLSIGGVHSHQDHISYIIKLLSKMGVEVVFHAFLDGRDVPQKSAIEYINKFYKDIEGFQNISFGTIMGRYYAMDRDSRWDRTEKAYQAIVEGFGEKASSFEDSVNTCYTSGNTDEFMLPVVIEGYKGISDGDAILSLNYRSDRIIQILRAICDPSFNKFERSRFVNFSERLGIVSYSKDTDSFMESLFSRQKFDNILGEVISKNHIKQFRIAETEKYAHITFFLNCGREEKFEGEDRVLIPSPNVSTYDQKPEMSAYEVTDNLVQAIESGEYGFILVNYANADMVGHSGDQEAAIKAVECIDNCIEKVAKAVNLYGGTMIITADHGNVETMKDKKNNIHKSHTLSQVYFILTGSIGNVELKNGSLCNIAATILDLMGIDKPEEMSDSLILNTKKL